MEQTKRIIKDPQLPEHLRLMDHAIQNYKMFDYIQDRYLKAFSLLKEHPEEVDYIAFEGKYFLLDITPELIKELSKQTNIIVATLENAMVAYHKQDYTIQWYDIIDDGNNGIIIYQYTPGMAQHYKSPIFTELFRPYLTPITQEELQRRDHSRIKNVIQNRQNP